MRFGIVGRSEMLLSAAEALVKAGHEIPIIMTRKEENYYQATQDDYRAFAESFGAHFVANASTRSSECAKLLKSADCDAVFSINWPSLISKSVLDIPKFGFFNVHPGDLPRYRGNACFNWAIINGEQQVGICVHQMVEELDAGDIIARCKIDLSPTTTVTDLFDQWRQLTPDLILESVEKFSSFPDCLEKQSADSSRWLRGYPRRPSDNRLDWNWSVEKIDRLIRASGPPFPGAFTTLEGEATVTIFAATIDEHPGDFLAMPGQILYRENETLFVATGDGMLAISDLRLHGCETHSQSLAVIAKSLRNRLL